MTDRFWKVRPIYDRLRKHCATLELEGNVCIDEQMIPFKGQMNAKVFVKNKPCRFGIKNFMLCGESELIYDFILYQGSTTEINTKYKAFGQTESTVMHLCDRIDKQNIRLYFDNYFNTFWLLEWLRNKQIYAIGTARVNRFAKPPFLSDKEIRKTHGRGYMQEAVSSDGTVVLTKWCDSSTVIMGSNYMGIGKIDKCRRYDQSERKYIQVNRPESVRLYNCNMGGVDKHDFLISIYRIFIRSKKWTLRLFTHAIDMAVTNSWLEYKARSIELGINKSRIMDLMNFRLYVAEALILSGQAVPKKRGRPSGETSDSPPVPAKRARVIQPLSEVRYDGLDHLPMFSDQKNTGRCKNEGCNGKTYVKCSKCQLHLCMTRAKNCYYEFHKK